jgi:hypothetical protein
MRQVLLAGLSVVGLLVTATPGFAAESRYCLQGKDWGYLGDCQFSTYDQCMASASGTAACCGINPAYGYAHRQREWIPNYGGMRPY